MQKPSNGTPTGHAFDHVKWSKDLQYMDVLAHPSNADELHKELVQIPSMAERDAVWTQPIVNTLCSKNSDLIKKHLDRKISKNMNNEQVQMLRLSAIFLGWCCTTTNVMLRHKATKKIAEGMFHHPHLMADLVEQFINVNDLYVVERMLAAAYGASCYLGGGDATHVASTADVVYRNMFANDKPPLHLLVRDYGQGIIERANHLGVLPGGIVLDKCRPPFKSPWPIQTYSNADIDNLAQKCGDTHKRIALSCVTEHGRGTFNYGDFGRYVLQLRVQSFTSTRLSQQPPDTVSLATFDFDEEMIGNWVAHRAYNYGWTADRFGADEKGNSIGRERSALERIGKKYQWIAMYELLGILSDNFWIKIDDSERGDIATQFCCASDLEFARDIDPTTSYPPQFYRESAFSNAVMSMPMNFNTQEDDKFDWPYAKTLNDVAKLNVEFIDDKAEKWFRLYAMTSHDQDSGVGGHLSSFGRLAAVCIRKNDMVKFLKGVNSASLQKGNFINPSYLMHRDPEEWHDQYFLGEMPWAIKDSNIIPWQYSGQLGMPYFLPIRKLCHESHVDKFHKEVTVPIPHLCSSMKLLSHRSFRGVFVNRNNEIVFMSVGSDNVVDEELYAETKKGTVNTIASGQIIRADVFEEYLHANNLVCVWIFGGHKYFLQHLTGDLYECFFNSVVYFNGKGGLSDVSWTNKPYPDSEVS